MEREQMINASMREAIAVLTAASDKPDGSSLLGEVVRARLEEGGTDALIRMFQGMTNVSMYLLTLRYGDTGILEKETLRQLGQKFAETD